MQALAVAVAAGAACDAMPTLGGDPVDVRVSVLPEGGGERVSTDTSALLLDAEWSTVVPGDIQRVVFVEPGGRVYQRRATPVGADHRAVVRLPVRGTDIDDYSILGTWRVYLYRNHATVPTRIVSFTVER